MASPLVRCWLGAGLGGVVSSGPSELYPSGNAASIGTEADSTGTWTNLNSTFTTDADADDGVLALKVVSTGGGGRIYFDLDTILSEGVEYSITSRVKHTGVGESFRLGLGDASTSTTDVIITLENTDTTYADANKIFTYEVLTHRYLVLREVNATNDGGAFIDTISIVAT